MPSARAAGLDGAALLLGEEGGFHLGLVADEWEVAKWAAGRGLDQWLDAMVPEGGLEAGGVIADLAPLFIRAAYEGQKDLLDRLCRSHPNPDSGPSTFLEPLNNNS